VLVLIIFFLFFSLFQSLTIVDDTLATTNDLADNFYITENDISTKRQRQVFCVMLFDTTLVVLCHLQGFVVFCVQITMLQ